MKIGFSFTVNYALKLNKKEFKTRKPRGEGRGEAYNPDEYFGLKVHVDGSVAGSGLVKAEGSLHYLKTKIVRKHFESDS